MQKAYKLYFSANLQLVIGKDSNDKKILSPAPPPPNAEMKEKPEQNKHRRVIHDFGII